MLCYLRCTIFLRRESSLCPWLLPVCLISAWHLWPQLGRKAQSKGWLELAGFLCRPSILVSVWIVDSIPSWTWKQSALSAGKLGALALFSSALGQFYYRLPFCTAHSPLSAFAFLYQGPWWSVNTLRSCHRRKKTALLRWTRPRIQTLLLILLFYLVQDSLSKWNRLTLCRPAISWRVNHRWVACGFQRVHSDQVAFDSSRSFGLQESMASGPSPSELGRFGPKAVLNHCPYIAMAY